MRALSKIKKAFQQNTLGILLERPNHLLDPDSITLII